MSNYSELLKDPRWQKKRLEILTRDKWECRFCGDGENTLHVHHLIYIQDKDPWEYASPVLVTLCEECHKAIHDCSEWVQSVIATLLAEIERNKESHYFDLQNDHHKIYALLKNHEYLVFNTADFPLSEKGKAYYNSCDHGIVKMSLSEANMDEDYCRIDIDDLARKGAGYGK